MRTLGDYLAPNPRKRKTSFGTLGAAVRDEAEVSNLLLTEPDWTEEEIEAAIQERLRHIRGRALLVLPRYLTMEEWQERYCR
jgi:hypothetical protein